MSRLLISLIRAYRYFLSPWLGGACRFTPTCSVYGIEAIQDHGAARGTLLTAWRLARCTPWCEGGFDPVPANGHLPPYRCVLCTRPPQD
jgi:putative membrane protein insertion efficiency factor